MIKIKHIILIGTCIFINTSCKKDNKDQKQYEERDLIQLETNSNAAHTMNLYLGKYKFNKKNAMLCTGAEGAIYEKIGIEKTDGSIIPVNEQMVAEFQKIPYKKFVALTLMYCGYNETESQPRVSFYYPINSITETPKLLFQTKIQNEIKINNYMATGTIFIPYDIYTKMEKAIYGSITINEGLHCMYLLTSQRNKPFVYLIQVGIENLKTLPEKVL